jgi:hypothetical protein
MVLLTVFLASIVLPHIPIANLIIQPMNSVATLVHEMGHAIAAILTGGSVSGLTIVNDGAGHGGLTFSRGGIPFIISQAGYLGTTIVGCALIALARFPQISKAALFTLGLAFAGASVMFMGATVLHGGILPGILSMVLGLSIAGTLIWLSIKSHPSIANLLLLFIGVQIGLNALTDVTFLLQSSLGWAPSGWSDATNMQKLTGIPAFVWAFLWSAASIGMLGGTIAWTYKADKNH